MPRPKWMQDRFTDDALDAVRQSETSLLRTVLALYAERRITEGTDDARHAVTVRRLVRAELRQRALDAQYGVREYRAMLRPMQRVG